MPNDFPRIPVTIADLLQNPNFAPGGASAEAFLLTYGPLVQGIAATLLPGDIAAQEGVVRAVFRTLAFRWKKLSKKKTVLALWLLQSAWFASIKERRARKFPKLQKGTAAMGLHLVCWEMGRQDFKMAGALILREILQVPAVNLLQPLRLKEAKTNKLAAKSLKAAAKRLRSAKVQEDALVFLRSIPAPLPAQLQESLGGELRSFLPVGELTPEVKRLSSAWRTFKIQKFFGRFFASLGVSVLVMFCVGATLAWLGQHGYLTNFGLRMQARQLAKEMPEIAVLARPWPVTEADRRLIRTNAPSSASDLYQLTNIWPVTLRFTPDGWKGIEPAHIQPGGDISPDGSRPLRNPHAKRSGITGMIGLEFEWTHATLVFGGEEFPQVAARLRGNGTYLNSLFVPKQSFKIDLNKYTKGQKLGGVRTLNLLNTIADYSYLHDTLGERLFRDLGVPGPRSAYAYVTLDVPGQFNQQALGLYVLMENVDADFAAERLGGKKTPVFKPVTPELFNDLGDDWKAYAKTYDLKTKATDDQLKRVVDFAKLVSHADDAEFARKLPEFLDLEEFAGFVAGHVLMSSMDGFLANGQNYYMYLDPTSNKFGFIPWDQDHGWGEFGYVGTAETREQVSIWSPATYDFHFLNRVMKVEAFRAIYRRRMQTALEKLFSVERLYPQIDQMAQIIRPAVAAENDFRLKRFDLSVTHKWVDGPRDGEHEGPKSPVHQMKRFITNRVVSVRDQLDGKSEGKRLNRH